MEILSDEIHSCFVQVMFKSVMISFQHAYQETTSTFVITPHYRYV